MREWTLTPCVATYYRLYKYSAQQAENNPVDPIGIVDEHSAWLHSQEVSYCSAHP